MPYDLERFLEAQEPVYAEVLQELRNGQKRGHWMWFIFPQLAGLGHSSTSQFFGIGSLDEAVAYWKHPILGRRLNECTTLVNETTGRSIIEIFGSIDAMKFRSSMTLFSKAASDGPFALAIENYFAGELDQVSLDLLAARGKSDGGLSRKRHVLPPS
ncbi:MAG: calpastatin [Gemmatimonadetes bacterium]|nr:calpastatin [Gemmatimonadota bacterium]